MKVIHRIIHKISLLLKTKKKKKKKKNDGTIKYIRNHFTL